MNPLIDAHFYSSRGKKPLTSEEDDDRALISNIRGIKMNQVAIKHYQYPNFYEQKGLIEISQGDKAKGIVSLRRALKDSRYYSCGPIHEQMGIALLELKSYEEALVEFEKAWSRYSRGGKMDFYWGLCFERLKAQQKALVKYRSSEKKTSFFTCFGRNHYKVLKNIDAGRYKTADKECKFLISINRNFVYAYFNRVIVLLCQKRTDKAIRLYHYIYQKLPEIYPKVKKIVRKYNKYLRKSQEQLKEAKDEKVICLLERKIQAIKQLLSLFDEQSPEKARLYDTYIPNIVLSITGILIVGIIFLLLFSSLLNREQ